MSDHRLSWLDLPEPASPPEVTAIFERTREKFGHVRNSQRMAATNPALAIAQDQLSAAVQRAPDVTLSEFERELIAIVVSAENRCAPCLFAHGAVMRGITNDPVLVSQIEANDRHVPLSPRLRALAEYARKITVAPQDITKTDIDVLREVGLNDREIFDAAAVAAYFNFSNRMNNALGVAPDPEAHRANR